MTESMKLGIKSILEQRKEYDAFNLINELEEEIENKNGIITSQSDALNKEYFINESLNSQLENLCKWETDIEDTLSDYEKGKYDNNEHQFVVDAFTIMNGVLNDIRRN